MDKVLIDIKTSNLTDSTNVLSQSTNVTKMIFYWIDVLNIRFFKNVLFNKNKLNKISFPYIVKYTIFFVFN